MLTSEFGMVAADCGTCSDMGRSARAALSASVSAFAAWVRSGWHQCLCWLLRAGPKERLGLNFLCFWLCLALHARVFQAACWSTY